MAQLVVFFRSFLERNYGELKSLNPTSQFLVRNSVGNPDTQIFARYENGEEAMRDVADVSEKEIEMILRELTLLGEKMKVKFELPPNFGDMRGVLDTAFKRGEIAEEEYKEVVEGLEDLKELNGRTKPKGDVCEYIIEANEDLLESHPWDTNVFIRPRERPD